MCLREVSENGLWDLLLKAFCGPHDNGKMIWKGPFWANFQAPFSEGPSPYLTEEKLKRPQSFFPTEKIYASPFGLLKLLKYYQNSASKSPKKRIIQISNKFSQAKGVKPIILSFIILLVLLWLYCNNKKNFTFSQCFWI